MLADIRHKPTADDRLMVEWLNSMGKPYIIIATKADKITRTHYKEHLLEIRKTLDLLPDVPVIPVSVTKNTGFDQLWNQVLKVLPELFPRDDGVNSPV